MPTVHNDYHSRASNQGYSRNNSGGIYPKWFLSDHINWKYYKKYHDLEFFDN
jgi:hypothetical protein